MSQTMAPRDAQVVWSGDGGDAAARQTGARVSRAMAPRDAQVVWSGDGGDRRRVAGALA